MKYISKKIVGIPYSQHKRKGNIEAVNVWTQAIVKQTKNLPKVTEACIANITFRLPPNKFPKDLPFGSDLDNLLKRFFDALNETIFSDAPGKDSCVISLNVTKVKVDTIKKAGVLLEIIPIKI